MKLLFIESKHEQFIIKLQGFRYQSREKQMRNEVRKKIALLVFILNEYLFLLSIIKRMRESSDHQSIDQKMAVTFKQAIIDRIKRKAQEKASREQGRAFRRKFLAKIRKSVNQRRFKVDKKQLNLKFEKFVEAKKEELQNIKTSSLVCPLCLGMLINPATTICGHVFCFKCIEKAFIYQVVCPICRTKARAYQLSHSIHFEKINDTQETLQHRIWGESSIAEQYFSKKRKYDKWCKKRFLNPDKLEIGEYVDVKDTDHIWCQARVEAIRNTSNKGEQLVKVHYLGRDRIYDEIISINSQRLAPFNFFTDQHKKQNMEQSQSDPFIKQLCQKWS